MHEPRRALESGLECYVGGGGSEREVKSIRSRSDSESVSKCLLRCPPLRMARLPVGTVALIASEWIILRSNGAYTSKVVFRLNRSPCNDSVCSRAGCILCTFLDKREDEEGGSIRWTL